MSFNRFCFPVFLAQPKYNLSIISISSFKRPYQSHLVWSSLLLLPVSLLLSSSASVVHEESSTSLNHHQNEKGVPGLMQCRYVVFLCRDMRKGIYVRRSASQNSFLARAFALQSNVNWLQTQLADWVRTHTQTQTVCTHTNSPCANALACSHTHIPMCNILRANSWNTRHIHGLASMPKSSSWRPRCRWHRGWRI